jgi:hypothetical protein
MSLPQWRLSVCSGAISAGMLTLSLALSLAAQPKQALVIDGNLGDDFWRDRAAQELVASPPGAATRAGGDFRAVVVGRYLCVAARLPEPTGRFTARLTGRNPSWEEEDALRILAGANIGYTDRIVQINPLGAYSIEKAVHVTYQNVAVFPYLDEWQRDVVYRDSDKFLVAASRGEKEWTVEVAIPLNQLSAPGPDHIFVSVERIRAARAGTPGQRWHWPAQGPAAKVPVDPSLKWDAPPPVYRPPQLGNQIVTAGDLPDVAAALAPCPLLLEGLVDARDRVMLESALRTAIAPVYASYRTSPARLLVRSKNESPNVPQWLQTQLSH